MLPDRLTAEEVMAHFACRTKAALLAQSVPTDEPDTAFDLYRRYRIATHNTLEQTIHRKLIEFTQLSWLITD